MITWSKFVIMTIVLLLTGDCSGADIQSAISSCKESYEFHTGKPIPESIDRVYIDYYPTTSVVHFASGESGLFGIRSESSESWFLCKVENKEGWPVYEITDLTASQGHIYSTEKADAYFGLQSRYLETHEVETCWFVLSEDKALKQSCKKWN